jgi:peptidoglycan-associated lipoprotein
MLFSKKRTPPAGSAAAASGQQITTTRRGDAAEALAAEYLAARGLRLLQRNFKTPGRGGGEIDLIMRAPDGTLVFVEVRQRASSSHGGAGASMATPGSPQDFISNVGDRVLFETDSTELTSVGQATLEKQARWLQQYPRYTFTMEGHADERGTREYNFALGARRAETAKNYLLAKGITASRMRTISYGKERPVAVCDDISCWSQNRRAVTVLSGGNS